MCFGSGPDQALLDAQKKQQALTAEEQAEAQAKNKEVQEDELDNLRAFRGGSSSGGTSAVPSAGGNQTYG